ncbi:MAG: hypothetical protein IKF90_05345 [Parasporobacterium sp.]|nr:hypothetical protein [Parasporobacterium sp.]
MKKQIRTIFAAILTVLLITVMISPSVFAQDYLWDPEAQSYSTKVVPGWNHVDSFGTRYWYYGDEDGNLVNGWQNIDGKRYAFLPGTPDQTLEDHGLYPIGWGGMGTTSPRAMLSGGSYALYEMHTQSPEDASIWSFSNSGAMLTGWVKASKYEDDQKINVWYYHDPDTGKAVSGWNFIDGKWYYFSPFHYLNQGLGYYTGCAMQTGWLYDNGSWYYLSSSGAMVTGWNYINGKWYYMRPSGAMHVGWLNLNGTWYYLQPSGSMATGWQWINGYWYFLKSSGAMACNEWLGGYWLGSSGAWTYQPIGSWKHNSKGWWFGDTSGWYAKNETLKINEAIFSFNAAGYWY